MAEQQNKQKNFRISEDLQRKLDVLVEVINDEQDKKAEELGLIPIEISESEVLRFLIEQAYNKLPLYGEGKKDE